MRGTKLVLFANSDWYLFNFRKSLAVAAQDAGYKVLLISPNGPYGQRLRDLGLRWIPAPMERRSLNPIRELALLSWLVRLIRLENADIVHGFTIKCAVYGGIAARFCGAARVNAVAGMGYVFTSDKWGARLLRPVLRAVMRSAFGGRRARTVLQNKDDVAIFEKFRMTSASQTRLIPGSGVDCTRFLVPSHSVETAKKPTEVVLAARMLWDKGISEFIEAARILKSEGRLIRFVLAGLPDPGNPATIPEEKLRRWERLGLVDWLGHVEDMPGLFANADIVVLPSYREGLPKSLIEAAICARAIVTTDVPGCREVVTDGIDGLLVPPRDATMLACAIARLHEKPELAHRLGEAARKKALAVYDERIIIAKTLEVYRELIQI